jgi:CRP-like cAMP-binding protein
MPSSSSPAPDRNWLLAALPRRDRERIAAEGRIEHLGVKEVVFGPDEKIKRVTFPLDGVVSLVAIMEDGTFIEVATIGNEGFVGLPVFLGAESIPAQAFSQIAGSALTLSVRDFREESARGTAFHRVMQRYAHALFNQVAQSAACNRAHVVTERCARWLLMTHDRVAVDTFPLTQEFLAQMLGVRRSAVNAATRVLEQGGMIRYRRDSMSVIDRGRLESAACECYRKIRGEYEAMSLDLKRLPG